MKLTLTIAALMLGTTIAASASTLGCETRKASNGNWLVYVNPDCAADRGPGRERIILVADEPEGPGEEPEDPGEDPEPEPEPETPEDKPSKPGQGHGDRNHNHSGPPGRR
jgi:hypothetical protein